jgi:hypothetical protein
VISCQKRLPRLSTRLVYFAGRLGPRTPNWTPKMPRRSLSGSPFTPCSTAHSGPEDPFRYIMIRQADTKIRFGSQELPYICFACSYTGRLCCKVWRRAQKGSLLALFRVSPHAHFLQSEMLEFGGESNHKRTRVYGGLGLQTLVCEAESRARNGTAENNNGATQSPK